MSNEILMSVAMILKRAIFDKKAGDIETFYTGVESLIQSNEASRQALACQALLSYCQEFQTSWRTADVGMTWDFHIRAKREFEVRFLCESERCAKECNFSPTNCGVSLKWS